MNAATDGGARTLERVGLCALPGEGVLTIQGKDTISYLQRMITNDVAGLAPGEGRRALVLDVKGHVQADGRFLRTGEDSVVVTFPREAHAPGLKILATYSIADELEIDDRTEAHEVVTVQGPRAEAVLARLAPGPLVFAKPLAHTTLTIAGAGVRVFRHDRVGQGGLDLLLPRESPGAREAVVAAVAAEGGGSVPEEALDRARIEAARSRFGADFGPTEIPQEAGLEQESEAALSWTKGCFLGQEVVARLRFRGHVNRSLVGLRLSGEAAPGAPLRRDGKDVGRLTSLVRSERAGALVGLGYVRREQTSPGTVVDVGAGTGVTATVVPRDGSWRVPAVPS